MATIYKAKAVGGTETITARVYSNGEEIHSAHPLYPRVAYQWYLDRLNGQPVETIAGATAGSYNVPLGDVSNSGEYYCVFTIGLTGCTTATSPRTRVSIVSCEGSTVNPNPVPWGGATTVQITILHAKFETAVFSTEGIDWITAIGTPAPCASCLSTTTSVASFSVAANSGANRARRGAVSLAIGGLKCYYNVVQDYERTVTADGTEADPPTAPFIELENNGPATAGGKVKVTASVGVPGVDASGTTGDYSINWSTNGRFSVASDELSAVYTKSTAGTLTPSATVTDNATLLTDTANTPIEFEAEPPEEEYGITNMIPSYVSTAIYTNDILGNPITRTASTSFEITDAGKFSIYISLTPNGLFGGLDNIAAAASDLVMGIEIILTGPGALNGREIITKTSTGGNLVSFTKEFTGVGHYTMSMRWTTDIEDYPLGGSMATASATVTPDQSGLWDQFNWDLIDWTNIVL